MAAEMHRILPLTTANTWRSINDTLDSSSLPSKMLIRAGGKELYEQFKNWGVIEGDYVAMFSDSRSGGNLYYRCLILCQFCTSRRRGMWVEFETILYMALAIVYSAEHVLVMAVVLMLHMVTHLAAWIGVHGAHGYRDFTWLWRGTQSHGVSPTILIASNKVPTN
jgi:hypothetical protein